MKTGLILSDMHCGSYYGIMPDSINIIDPRTHEPLTFKANSAQRDMFKLWKEMCETVKPDFVLVNGDVADGPQRKSMGQTTITNNLKDQCEIAIKLLKMIDCDTFYFTLGSGYHSMDDRPLEQYVAERMNGVYGDDLIIECEQTRIHASHNVPVSASSWQYRSTPLARDLLLHKLNDSARSYGDIDVVIRSHAHYHVAVMFTHQLGLITPCWQTRTPFAVKRDIISPPDIGYIVLNIDGKQVDMKRRIVHIGKPSPVVTVKK